MKKTLTVLAFVSLIASNAFAEYIVVLKDGTKIKAKAKWTIVNGRALITLPNGQTMLLNPAEIDAAKSEQVTKSGLGDLNVISLDAQGQAGQQKQPRPQDSLAAQVRANRRTPTTQPITAGAGAAPVTPAPILDQLDSRVKDTFERAFENVGIYEHKLAGTNRNIRAEMTADNEDRVFNVLSATAFLVGRNAGVEGLTIDRVELFMRTTNGGAAGRFQMSRADADAINSKTLSIQEYFVRKVIY
jgi:hypothetical protein